MVPDGKNHWEDLNSFKLNKKNAIWTLSFVFKFFFSDAIRSCRGHGTHEKSRDRDQNSKIGRCWPNLRFAPMKSHPFCNKNNRKLEEFRKNWFISEVQTHVTYTTCHVMSEYLYKRRNKFNHNNSDIAFPPLCFK